MKYLKLFEEFVITKPKPKEEINLSDKTIDEYYKAIKYNAKKQKISMDELVKNLTKF